MNGLEWVAAYVELVPGFTIRDAENTEVDAVEGDIAIQGGYLHVAVPGRSDVQVLGAPGVRRVTYPQVCVPLST